MLLSDLASTKAKEKTITNPITTGGTKPPESLNTEILYGWSRKNKKRFSGYTSTYRYTYRERNKNQYRIFARIYHSKKNSESTSMTSNQLEEHLKDINNAYDYLSGQL